MIETKQLRFSLARSSRLHPLLLLDSFATEENT
jgi:hypothetical protein